MFYCIQSLFCYTVLITTTNGGSELFMNQPKLCPSATWHPYAETFADNNTVGFQPNTVFIDRNNSVYVAVNQFSEILMWKENATVLMRNISAGLSRPHGLFVTARGDIYVDNGYINGRVEKWSVNDTGGTMVMNVSGCCDSLFVDINDTLYCTVVGMHQVVKQSLSASSGTMPIVAAGNGTAGNTSILLDSPQGIYVDQDLNLYVADFGNDRIQRFRSGESNATTVAGVGTPMTIAFSRPRAVILDADGFMFIADSSYHRIIRSGPNGFRCIVGCTGSSGPALNQLNGPWALSFDRYGNLFVTDRANDRIQKFHLATNSCGISYNQPKFCPYATWNSSADTFANYSGGGGLLWSLFINTDDTVYLTERKNNFIHVWSQSNTTTQQIIDSSWVNLSAVFVTINGDIYVGNNNITLSYFRVFKRKVNTTINETVMIVQDRCYGLFIDFFDNIYCSMDRKHAVVKRLFYDPLNLATTVAGNGTPQAAANTLSSPLGIFVTVELGLYVADCGNDRVQFFRSGERNAITVAGSGAAGTINLSCPSAVILDGDGYMFIADYNNSRIVGEGANGFRCVAGCISSSGSLSDPLNLPNSLSFDSDGNIYAIDTLYGRIQKFSFLVESCDVSYNEPTFCPSATWNPNADTFAHLSTVGVSSSSVFLDKRNSVYAVTRVPSLVYVWLDGNATIPIILTNSINQAYSTFATMNGDIYVDSNVAGAYRVEKWRVNATSGIVAMHANGFCLGLFVDIYGSIYCSVQTSNTVVKRVFNDDANTTTIIAGNGTMGAAANMLASPRGIWVDKKLNLYVTDSDNDRIQMFPYGQMNATTIVGNGAPGTIDLDGPSGVVLDGNGYLFITELYNHRVVGSGPGGYRCIAGCSRMNGSAANQLARPRALSFDSIGNLFVIDGYNDRIQKFLLASNSCAPQGSAFASSTCLNWTMMGVYCNISSQPCDILQPCENSATCINTNSTTNGFLCICPLYFDGTRCENDRRPCQQNTCLNSGACHPTSKWTFSCQCVLGWEGVRCERRVNYCDSETCQNDAVCRSLVGDYRCECLGSSYSGHHCEITHRSIVFSKTIAKSFASLAIIAMASVASFVIIMDVLKYGFGIDPVNKEQKRKKLPSKKKTRTLMVVRYIYVHSPPTSSVEIHTIA